MSLNAVSLMRDLDVAEAWLCQSTNLMTRATKNSPSAIESTEYLAVGFGFRLPWDEGKKGPVAVLGLETKPFGLGGIGPKGFDPPESDREKLSEVMSSDCVRADPPTPR